MIIEQIVNASGLQTFEGFDYHALTTPYNRQAIVLMDIVSLTSKKNIPIPMPLVGFEYNYESDVPFIVNEYSEYPYLNKQLLVEGAIKQNPTFSLNIHNLITEFNPYTVKEMVNKVLVDGLQAYVNAGGTFAILTPWSDIDLCVLTGLYGIRNEADQCGITYRAEFKKLTPVRGLVETLSYKLASYITGAII